MFGKTGRIHSYLPSTKKIISRDDNTHETPSSLPIRRKRTILPLSNLHTTSYQDTFHSSQETAIMASTLTETTRSALMSHVPSSPSTKNTSDIISQLKDSASNTPQTSNTSNIRDPARSSFDAASQSLLAQNMAQMSRHSSQQAGLSSLAIAAMAGGKMKEEPMQNR